MTIANWSFLAHLIEEGVAPNRLPANLESVIAERLEEALAGAERAELDDIKATLSDFFSALLRQSPPDAAAAVRGAASASEDSVAAFWLGQVAFAQHLAAQAAERRADDRFTDVFSNASLVGYVRALAKSDHTGRELATLLSVRPETVSRRLNELRELGVVDYRRDGTSLYNFLTPQARAAFDSLVEPEALPHRDPAKVRLMRSRQQNVSNTFRDWPTLSNPPLLGN